MTDDRKQTVLYRTDALYDHRIVKYILAPLSASQRFKILSMKDYSGNTLLHCAAKQKSDNHGLIENVLTSLPESERVDLVSMQNRVGKTALHYAANNRLLKPIKCLLGLLPKE